SGRFQKYYRIIAEAEGVRTKPSSGMARRVQGRAKIAVQLRLFRANDRGRAVGQHRVARRQKDPVGFEEAEGDECAGGESVFAHAVSERVESVTTNGKS